MLKKKVVVIGGGTGTFTALKGLKKYPLSLSVIVSMMDSGGSNRVIRDEFGLLPTSDIRQCIVALASQDSNGLIRELFTYRYSQGTGITGMSFGNLFMAALTDIYGSQEEAIRKTCELLRVKGNIIPVTFDDSHLVARYENGKQVLGEHAIDEPTEEIGRMRIVELTAFPPAKANPAAIKAIHEADLVVLGPGDLYTSILCNLVIDGISEAILATKGRVAYVLNLMTKYGQTEGFTATDHLAEVEKYLGDDAVDYCLANKADLISPEILKRYQEEGAEPVQNDLFAGRVKVIRKDFVSDEVFKKAKADKLKRSLIRHDSDKLAKALVALL